MAKATKPGKAKQAKLKPAEKTQKKLGVKKKIAKKKAALPLPGGHEIAQAYSQGGSARIATAQPFPDRGGCHDSGSAVGNGGTAPAGG
jgi:hypothetical protein